MLRWLRARLAAIRFVVVVATAAGILAVNAALGFGAALLLLRERPRSAT